MKGVFYLLTACMAVSVLCSCNGKKEAQEDVQYVMTATAKGGGNESQQTYPARTRSMEETNVAFRVSGTIERVFVKEGDYVRKGQLIATMDARDYRVQLEATQAEYAQIKADAERVFELYKEQATTASNYDKARYGLSQITQKLQHHKNQLADCTRLSAAMCKQDCTKLARRWVQECLWYRFLPIAMWRWKSVCHRPTTTVWTKSWRLTALSTCCLTIIRSASYLSVAKPTPASSIP